MAEDCKQYTETNCLKTFSLFLIEKQKNSFISPMLIPQPKKKNVIFYHFGIIKKKTILCWSRSQIILWKSNMSSTNGMSKIVQIKTNQKKNYIFTNDINMRTCFIAQFQYLFFFEKLNEIKSKSLSICVTVNFDYTMHQFSFCNRNNVGPLNMLSLQKSLDPVPNFMWKRTFCRKDAFWTQLKRNIFVSLCFKC